MSKLYRALLILLVVLLAVGVLLQLLANLNWLEPIIYWILKLLGIIP